MSIAALVTAFVRAPVPKRLTPSNEQTRAIRAIADWYRNEPGQQQFYLAGYAGAGKTTIARLAVDEIAKKMRKKIRVRYAAYTGKAADVLRRKGGVEADTIHRLIYRPVADEDGHVTFELNPESELLDCDLLVLDESSMVSQTIAGDLLSFGVKMLILGDPGQLPPIEGTSPFLTREPDFFLHEIHRQAADNPIIRLATAVRTGGRLPYGEFGPGVRRIPRDMDAVPYVLDEDAQVICGVHRVRWKTTRWMREQRGHTDPLPVAGERLICCRNQHQLGLYNGSMVRLTGIRHTSPQEAMIAVTTDDGRDVADLRTRTELFLEHGEGRAIPKDRGFFNRAFSHFDFAYVISCHKAQGSSWPRVTVLDDSRAFRADAAKWLYTAITRAEDELTIISDQ